MSRAGTTVMWLLGTLSLLLCAGATRSFAQAVTFSPLREVLLPLDLAPAEIEWVRGHVVVIHRPAISNPGPGDHYVAVVDREGRQIFRKYPGKDVPDAIGFLVNSATVAPDSTLTVAASATDRAGRNGQLLVQYDLKSGTLRRVLRTNPVYCQDIAADAQGAVWCVGMDVDKRARGLTEFDLIHKYSTDGVHAAQLVNRRVFDERTNPLRLTNAGYPKLLSTGNEMAAIFPAAGAVFRWTLDGRLRSQAAYPLEGRRQDTSEEITMLDDGRLLSMQVLDTSNEPSRWRRTLVETAPSGTAWRRLDAFPDFSLSHHLIGLDGSALVLWDMSRRSLVWAAIQP